MPEGLALFLLPVSFGLNAFFLLRVLTKLDTVEKWFTDPAKGIFVRVSLLEQSRDGLADEVPSPHRRRHTDRG